MRLIEVIVRPLVPALVVGAIVYGSSMFGTATGGAFAEAPRIGPGPVAPKETTEIGWFKSFADGVLVMEKQKQGLTTMEVAIPIPADAVTTRWSHAAKRNVAVDTAEAMRQLKILATPGRPPADSTPAGAAESLDWRRTGDGLVIKRSGSKATIQIGKENPPFVGKFVGFADDKLAFQVTKRDGRYSKLYGQTVNLRMNEWIAVYESVDGGEYRWVGSPRTALADLKEGTSVAIYHSYKTEIDEFHLVLIGIADKP